eukprot:GHVS01063165.1.p1 GENE.GHVS01063165.1~~GHVS01063165.1.p1  ORF type:complete len:777 (+),score=82.43 GHVS01063165.1:1111-3441(+)
MPGFFARCADMTVGAGLSVEAITDIRQIVGQKGVQSHMSHTEQTFPVSRETEKESSLLHGDEYMEGVFESGDDQGGLGAEESRFLYPCINWYEQELEKDLERALDGHLQGVSACSNPDGTGYSSDVQLFENDVGERKLVGQKGTSLLGTLPLCSSWLRGFWEAHALLLISGLPRVCDGRSLLENCVGKLSIDGRGGAGGEKNRTIQNDDDLMLLLAEQLRTRCFSMCGSGSSGIRPAIQLDSMKRKAEHSLLQHCTWAKPNGSGSGYKEEEEQVFQENTPDDRIEMLSFVSGQMVSLNMELLLGKSVRGLHASYRSMLLDLLLDECCLLEYLAALRSIAMLQAADSLQDFLATLVAASKQAVTSGSSNPVVFVDPQAANQFLREAVAGSQQVPVRELEDRKRPAQLSSLRKRGGPTEVVASLDNATRCRRASTKETASCPCAEDPSPTERHRAKRSSRGPGGSAAAHYVASLLFVDVTLVEVTNKAPRKCMPAEKCLGSSRGGRETCVAPNKTSVRGANLLRADKLTECMKSFYLVTASNPLNAHTKLSFRNLQIRSTAAGPLAPLLSERVMTAYSAIFSYFLQIHLCYHHLTEVFYRLPPHASSSSWTCRVATIEAPLYHACRLLHHQLLHFLQTLCTHIAEVLAHSWQSLTTTILSLQRLCFGERMSQVEGSRHVGCVEQLAGVHNMYVIAVLKDLMVPVDHVSQMFNQKPESSSTGTPNDPTEILPTPSHPFAEDMCLVLTAADKLNFVVRTASDNPALESVRCWGLRQVRGQ